MIEIGNIAGVDLYANTDSSRVASIARSVIRGLQQHQWIDAGDRMPRIDEPVLGWNANANGAWVYMWRGRQWLNLSGDGGKNSKGFNISHWMPLPTGPKPRETVTLKQEEKISASGAEQVTP